VRQHRCREYMLPNTELSMPLIGANRSGELRRMRRARWWRAPAGETRRRFGRQTRAGQRRSVPGVQAGRPAPMSEERDGPKLRATNPAGSKWPIAPEKRYHAPATSMPPELGGWRGRANDGESVIVSSRVDRGTRPHARRRPHRASVEGEIRRGPPRSHR
jgi:hypothetical protein